MTAPQIRRLSHAERLLVDAVAAGHEVSVRGRHVSWFATVDGRRVGCSAEKKVLNQLVRDGVLSLVASRYAKWKRVALTERWAQRLGVAPSSSPSPKGGGA